MSGIYTDIVEFILLLSIATTIISLVRKIHVYVPLLLSIYLCITGVLSIDAIMNNVSTELHIAITDSLGRGITINFNLNPLNAVFLLAFTLIGIPVAFYSLEYLVHHHRHEDPRHYWLYLSLSYFFVLVFLLSDNFLVFLFSLDALIIFLGLLIAFDRTYVKARAAARIYIIMGLLASALIIMSLSIIYFEVNAYSFSELRSAMRDGTVASTATLFLALLLGVIGFSIKSGIVPFHSWLPRAHAEAPTPISALLSGFIVNTGLYGLLVLLTSIGVVFDTVVLLMMAIGLISVIYGAIMALAQDDVKRLLAYSTISHMGYLFVMTSTMYSSVGSENIHHKVLGVIMLSSILLYMLCHGVTKAALFLIAGNIISHIGTRDLNKMGGLAKEMKLDYIAVVLASIVMIGLPPAIGFQAKTLYHLSILGMEPGALVFDVSIAVFSAVITTSYLLKIVYKGFVREAPHTEYYGIITRHKEKIPELMTYPLYLLIGTTIFLGLWTRFTLSLINNVSSHAGVSKEIVMEHLVVTSVLVLYLPPWANLVSNVLAVVAATAITPLSIIVGFWLWTHIEVVSYEFHKIADLVYHAYFLRYTRRTLYGIVAKLEVIEDNYWLTLLASLALLLLMLVMLLR